MLCVCVIVMPGCVCVCVLLLRVLMHAYRWGRLEVEARFIEISISVCRWKAVIFSPLHNGFTFRICIYLGSTPAFSEISGNLCQNKVVTT